MVKTRSQNSNNNDIFAAQQNIRLNLLIQVFVRLSFEQSFTLHTDRCATFGEIKQHVMNRLIEPFASRIDILDGSGNRVLPRNDDDIIGPTYHQNETVRVRITPTETAPRTQHNRMADPPANSNYTNRSARPPPRPRVPTGAQSFISSAAQSMVEYMSPQVHTDDLYDDQDPDFRRQLQAAMEASKSIQQPAVGQYNDIPTRSCRESWGVGEPRRRQHLALPSSTSTRSPRGSVLEDYGRVVGRGTMSQYTHGGVSACTSICLVAAQYLLQQTGRDIGDVLSTEMLDLCVLEGSRHHSTLGSAHTALEDVWIKTCPFIEGLEQGLPYQNVVSVENYHTALTMAWQYAVERGQNAVAVVLTKAPETILCFGKSKSDQSGPEWFLFDSHGDAHMEGDKVVYVLRVPSTPALASALATKYPPMDLGDVDEEYMLQLYGQFEATPIIQADPVTSAKPPARGVQTLEHTTPEPEYVQLAATDVQIPEPTPEPEHIPTTSTTETRGFHSSVEVHHVDTEKSAAKSTDKGHRVAEQVEEEPESSGIKTSIIQGEVSRTRASDVVETASVNGEELKVSSEVSSPVDIGAVFLRTPRGALGMNDILIATSLCHEDEFVDISHACESNGELRCMVTSCCSLIPIAEAQHCHRCGRPCCEACRQFGVSSAACCDDSLSPVCLECASDLLDTVDLPNMQAEKTKATVIKQVLGPRYDAIFERAKQLLVIREDSRAARVYNGALNEIRDKIEILEEEKAALQSSPLVTHIEPDGDYVMGTAHSVEVISASRPPDPPQRSARRFITSEAATPGETRRTDIAVSDTFNDWYKAYQSAGRDRYPLPFALQYPTPLMVERRQHLVEDLEAWMKTSQRDLHNPYLAQREQLQEKRSCLIEEVTALRAHYGGSGHISDDDRVSAARSHSVCDDSGGSVHEHDDDNESTRRSRVGTASHMYNAFVECCPRCRRTGPYPLYRGSVLCPHCQHNATTERYEY